MSDTLREGTWEAGRCGRASAEFDASLLPDMHRSIWPNGDSKVGAMAGDRCSDELGCVVYDESTYPSLAVWGEWDDDGLPEVEGEASGMG